MIPLLLLLAIGGMMQAARSFTTDTALAGTELGFGFLLLASFFTGKIFNRLGLPKLTGYLAAGVIAGPYVLEFVTKDMGVSLKVVSSTATAILALEAGSELEIKKIKPILKTLRGITLFAVVGSMFMIAGALFFMRPMFPAIFDKLDTQQSIAVCFAIGVALSAQSPAVVMAMLAETRAEGPLSRTMLASVVVADLTVITLFSIVLAITGAVIGGQVDVAGTAISVVWELLGSMVFGVLLGMLIGQFLLSVKKGASMFTLLVNVIVAEIGVRMHLDPLIVMLAAGIWLRNFSRADSTKMMHDFHAAQLPVFLVFFALAGAKLDLDTLVASIVPVAILAGARAASFFIGGKIATRVTDAPPLVHKYAWFGLMPQAGLALALALVMEKTFPTFGGPAAVIMIGVVGFNELIAPVILRAMLLRTGEAGKKEGPAEHVEH